MDLVKFVRRIRRGQNQMVGVLVAKKVDDQTAVVGWSKCHVGKDHFDKIKGLDIAVKRIEKYAKDPVGWNASRRLAIR